MVKQSYCAPTGCTLEKDRHHGQLRYTTFSDRYCKTRIDWYISGVLLGDIYQQVADDR